MKVKALRSHRERDEKRGIMVVKNKGEEFSLDPATEGPMIFELHASRRINIIDPAFIPERAKYKVLYGFSYETKEGFPRHGSSGSEIELDQMTANEFLACGYVRPVNENAWRPGKLLGGVISEKEPKRMFDDPPVEKESWIWKGRK